MGALYSGAQYGLKCKGLNIREYAPIRADVRMKAKYAVVLWLLGFINIYSLLSHYVTVICSEHVGNGGCPTSTALLPNILFQNESSTSTNHTQGC